MSGSKDGTSHQAYYHYGEPNSRAFSDEAAYIVGRQGFLAGFQALNRYLTGMMDGSIGWRSQEMVEAILNVLDPLRAFYGISRGEVYEADPWDQTDPRDLEQGMRRHTLKDDGLDSSVRPGLRSLIRGVVARQEDSFDEFIEGAAFLYGFTLYGWKDGVSSQNRQKIAHERASQEAQRARQTTAQLALLGGLLAAEPIQASSGQWDPVLERARTYADVAAELANEMVKLPDFRALCRVTVNGTFRNVRVKTPSFVILDEAHANPYGDAWATNREAGRTRARAKVEEQQERRLRRLLDDDGPGSERVVEL
jgi:hypothetical protein